MNCPCCSQPLPEIKGFKLVPEYSIVMTADSAVLLSHGEFKIFSAAVHHKVPFVSFVKALYDDRPDGGPLTPKWCVSVTLSKLNKKLKSLGYRLQITKSGSDVSLYGLVKL